MIASKTTSPTIKLALTLLCISLLQVSPALSPIADAKSKNKSKGATATTVVSQSGDDEAQVRAQIASLAKALEAADAKALATIWTEDGNYVTDAGVEYKGRAALEKRFGDVFTTEGKQLVDFVTGSSRLLSPGVMLVEGVVRRKGAPAEADPETRYSMVFVKRGDVWLISTAGERPFAAADTKNPLQALSWMIGDWSADKDGGFVHMKAEWAANNNFINCTYETKKSANDAVVDSRQVIGWDPRTGQPVSWHFDSNGGFGHGDWLKKDNQWLVKATGVDRDGDITTATNVISESGPNSFSWQSIDRSVNGVVFGDTVPLKVQRVTK